MYETIFLSCMGAQVAMPLGSFNECVNGALWWSGI